MFTPSEHHYDIDGGEWLFFGKEYSGYMMKCKNENKNNNILLLSHGCGGNISHYTEVLHKFSKYLDVFIYDYPGYGMSKGEPSRKTIKRCSHSAYQYLSKKGYNNIYCYGHSLGSTIALDLGIHHQIKGVIIRAGFEKLADCVPVVGKYVLNTYFNNTEDIHKIKCPVHIGHHRFDKVAPYWSAESIHDKLTHDKRFIDLSEDQYQCNGHNCAPNDAYIDDVAKYFGW